MSIIATPNFGIIPSAASASYPNEPAGATSVFGAQGWPVDWSNVVAKNPPETTSQPWEGVYYAGAPGNDYVPSGKGDTVSDQSGPVNPTVVGRCKYNATNAPAPFGDSIFKASSFDILVVPSNVLKSYLSLRVKFSADWFLAAEVIKLFNFWGAGGSQAAIAEIHAHGAARSGYEDSEYTEAPYYLETRIANAANNSYIGQVGGAQTSYFDNDPRMYNGVWYQVEYRWDWVTRFCEMFLDGTLVADGTATSASWGYNNSETSFDGTFGGQNHTAPELAAEQHLYLDDLYLSYTTT